MSRLSRVAVGALAGLALGGLLSTAEAQAMSGDQFYVLCGANGSQSDRDFCLGYVFAIAEALYAVPDKTVCFEGASPEVLLDAVVSYVGNQPAPRADQAGSLVAIALETSFPCS